MSIIKTDLAALAVLYAVCVAPSLFGQDFSEMIKKEQERNNRAFAPASSTYVKPAIVNVGAMNAAQALVAAGSDLSKTAVVGGHAKVYIDIIDGKYPGADTRNAAAMLGLLGSSNSPLVGNPQWIQPMAGRLLKAYSGSAETKNKATALLSLALVAGANYTMPAPAVKAFPATTIGAGTLNFLGGVVLNDSLKFEVRRAAVIALASIHKAAAVTEAASLINALDQADGDDKDKVFEINEKGELEDTGTGAETLQASLILALEEQLNWEASGQALSALKYYANFTGESCSRRWYGSINLGLKIPDKPGVNKTTLVMARYILAEKSHGYQARFSEVSSTIKRTQNGSGKVFLKEVGTAACLIPVIEEEGFKCGTRRAFNKLYADIAFPGGNLYDADNPPVMPVSFDNCLKARTQKLMLNIAADVLLGAAIEHLGLVAIRYGARYISTWSIDTAYKVVAVGGKLSTANRYAKFGGSIGEYAEVTAHLWEGYSTYHDARTIMNTTRESLE